MGLLQNVRERRPLDGLMCRNNELQRFLGHMLLEPNMAATLAHDDPAIPTQSPNHPIVVQARDLGHTAISMTSAFGESAASSSTGSRYSWTASWMLAKASSRVSP